MQKVISFFLLVFLTFSCASQTTSTVNTAYLSQTEIEENLTKELKLDLKIKNIGYKIQKTFVDKCSSKKLDLGLMTISEQDIKSEISVTLNNITSFGRLVDKNIMPALSAVEFLITPVTFKLFSKFTIFL